ncbi:hypothetical protein B0T21DRAFT_279761 [Apiosordaria backusii]|uniref:Microbial-type PARG catalytic domain-containing protein n=1 Tax=Apiosordaria backusii TaxID=314023 RepID=A0AA40K6K4_9PEZI|nr:hypothetical protein B0T21DRAFT_279761 [Apiosordaria backusii]
MPSSSSKSKPKPSEVASEAKRVYIPYIREHYASRWPTCSIIYAQPLAQISFIERPLDLSPPTFYVRTGDPVNTALEWISSAGCQVPFICAANDKRPGGDWETNAVGYEERLCRRSTLAACLATPAEGSPVTSYYNFSLPNCAGILSPSVVVFRGAHDKYEELPMEQWQPLPVVSVRPTRWPRLTQNGTKYSFAEEREMVKEKMRGALRICASNNYSIVVIGNFGLGNNYRNPPQELAELWREVCLYDPDLRGRIRCVSFVFEDPTQSTTQLILDRIAKARGSSSGASSRSETEGSSSSSSVSSMDNSPSDFEIFSRVEDAGEIQRFLAQSDARYGLNNILL